jgi:flagellar biosynthetic protein FliQ
MSIGRDAILTALMIGAPFFAVSLIVGLVVSVFQAMTQINEMTLTFVPKLLGLVLILLFLGPWILQQSVQFAIRMLDMLPQMVK